ncbi:chemotaxis protein CheB [uncultured Thiodictyon sp.]|uniref:chemotaxis protein CheB n=1 Tax=uncultured Thiodictyon sp. TaxID=1846217 RepID=UPI0025E4131C|nr:chemotaxis protein CheB [uncultured Thiodictyon sp.]
MMEPITAELSSTDPVNAQTPPPLTGNPAWVVGIGASAGGLEAMRPLVHELRPTGRAAYIVAQHFPRASADNLTEILGRDCPLRVKRIEDGEPLRPDQLFVTPPGCQVEIRDHRLRLLEPSSATGVVPCIDTLFESLAQGYGARAVGVLLSGTGRDGTRGAEAIRNAGGRVLVQRPDSAAQGGMAQAALDAGLANDSLTPQDLAAWLNTMDEALPEDLPATAAQAELDVETLKEVLALVTAASQTDFSRYKEATLRRQVLRRIAALHLSTPADYLLFMGANPEEALALRQCFMISVSAFFRDRAVFDALRGILEGLVATRRPNEPIRVWVPGCASGEEAYSIAAILAALLGGRLSEVGVAVFATDLDTQAIAAARAGVYPRSRLDGLDAGLRERFFAEGRDSVRVSKTLRELCVFAEHDLLRHPPFTRMDLVSCRNVLIYLSAALQDEVFAKFHYALNPGGLLLLGKSECGETVSRLFEPVDAHNRIYRRRNLPTPHLAHGHWDNVTPRFVSPSRPRPEVRPLDTEATLRDALLAHYAPPSVLVNDRFAPLHFHGKVQRYLNLPQGPADFSVVALSLPELANEVRTTAHLALLPGHQEVRGRPTPVEIEGASVMVRVVARRIDARLPGGEAVLALSFEEQPACAETAAAPPDAIGHLAVDELLRELQATRGHLHAIIGELESSNTELQSLNEELQVSTEELQSTNEELQAGNEELSTLNDELQAKTAEFAAVNDLLNSIQTSIQLALVVVDEQYRVRRFNALAVRIFGLVADDLGQSLAGVPCTLRLPALRQQVESVIQGGPPLVQQVAQEDRYYLMQIAPQIDAAGRRIGAVLSFADTSELTRSEAQRVEAEERFRLFMDHSPAIAWIKDAEGRHIYLSRTFEQRFGVRLEDWQGKTDAELGTASAAEALWRADREALAAGRPIEQEDETLGPDGQVRVWHSINIPFCDASGRRYVGGIGIDITEGFRAEQEPGKPGEAGGGPGQRERERGNLPVTVRQHVERIGLLPHAVRGWSPPGLRLPQGEPGLRATDGLE